MIESRCIQGMVFGMNSQRKSAVHTVLCTAVEIDRGYLLKEEISEAM